MGGTACFVTRRTRSTLRLELPYGQMATMPLTKCEAETTIELQLIGSSQPIPAERFLSVGWILLTKPHVVDGRLTGTDIVECWQDPSQQRVTVTTSVPQLPQGGVLRIRRKLVPRNPRRYSAVYEECRLQSRELSIYTEQPSDSQQDLESVVQAPFKFVLRFGENNCLSLLASSKPCPRLTEKLFACIERWANGVAQDNKQIQIASLGLVSVERYSRIYSDLKLKYGQKLVNSSCNRLGDVVLSRWLRWRFLVAQREQFRISTHIWPERTDPLKFVYEDIAIASYLIALWDPDNEGRKTSFVDIGCGNGLLVYILILEGHTGVGVDVRQRHIWALYPPEVRDVLREEPVTPESSFDVEWWIGNHSDELTPWIPLLASMTSATAKVFLLPCCPYNLYGKYQRSKPDLSQYQSYLAYLKDDFLPECGFKVRVDKMRIPSTKRICLVLTERLDEPRDKLVARLRYRVEAEKTSTSFVPRSKEILVRNCTQLDRKLTDSIVQRVAFRLLSVSSDKGLSEGFNIGGELSLSEVVALVDDRERSLLKSQCGGLQTLLKNNYHVFQVKNGAVKLKIPEESQQSKTQGPVRQARACWFDSNHPQGCPLDRAKCRFAHQS